MLNERKKNIQRDKQEVTEPVQKLLRKLNKLKDPKAELNNYLMDNFICLLEICQQHIQMLNNIALDYAHTIDITPGEFVNFKNDQEVRYNDIIDKLQSIHKKVFY